MAEFSDQGFLACQGMAVDCFDVVAGFEDAESRFAFFSGLVRDGSGSDDEDAV